MGEEGEGGSMRGGEEGVEGCDGEGTGRWTRRWWATLTLRIYLHGAPPHIILSPIISSSLTDRLSNRSGFFPDGWAQLAVKHVSFPVAGQAQPAGKTP